MNYPGIQHGSSASGGFHIDYDFAGGEGAGAGAVAGAAAAAQGETKGNAAGARTLNKVMRVMKARKTSSTFPVGAGLRSTTNLVARSALALSVW